ncbi:hypothetical protein ACQJBY_060138 [Aegilops geniculata]
MAWRPSTATTAGLPTPSATERLGEDKEAVPDVVDKPQPLFHFPSLALLSTTRARDPVAASRRSRGHRLPRHLRRHPREPPQSTSSIPSRESRRGDLYTRHRHHLHRVNRRRPPSILNVPVHPDPLRSHPRLRDNETDAALVIDYVDDDPSLPAQPDVGA